MCTHTHTCRLSNSVGVGEFVFAACNTMAIVEWGFTILTQQLPTFRFVHNKYARSAPMYGHQTGAKVTNSKHRTIAYRTHRTAHRTYILFGRRLLFISNKCVSFGAESVVFNDVWHRNGFFTAHSIAWKWTLCYRCTFSFLAAVRFVL